MAGYDNDYECSMYDFYMLTGEGAEYFEDVTEEGEGAAKMNVSRMMNPILKLSTSVWII